MEKALQIAKQKARELLEVSLWLSKPNAGLVRQLRDFVHERRLGKQKQYKYNTKFSDYVFEEIKTGQVGLTSQALDKLLELVALLSFVHPYGSVMDKCQLIKNLRAFRQKHPKHDVLVRRALYTIGGNYLDRISAVIVARIAYELYGAGLASTDMLMTAEWWLAKAILRGHVYVGKCAGEEPSKGGQEIANGLYMD